MSESKEFARTQAKDVAKEAEGQSLHQTGEVILPPVDVYEDEKGIRLTADLPGVTNERLNLKVDKDTLLIEGEATLDTPKNIQAIYAEVRNPRYRRSFALSSELDTGAIEAKLKDGVLTVHLPKKAPYQPRKIQVETA